MVLGASTLIGERFFDIPFTSFYTLSQIYCFYGYDLSVVKQIIKLDLFGMSYFFSLSNTLSCLKLLKLILEINIINWSLISVGFLSNFDLKSKKLVF